MNSDYLKFLRKNRTMVIASDGAKIMGVQKFIMHWIKVSSFSLKRVPLC